MKKIMTTIVITSLMMWYHNVDAMKALPLEKETINQSSKIQVSDSDKEDEVISHEFLRLVENGELGLEDKAEKINQFIKKYPNITTNNKHAVEALSTALKRGYGTVINYLFDNGIDVNISDSQRCDALIFFAKKGNVQRFKDLVEDIDSCGQTLLCYVDNVEILDYLVEIGARPNVTDTLKCTPLYRAIRNNNEKKVQWLIDHGAKVNDENGYGLLREAIRVNNKKIFQYLIDKGADVKEYVDRLLWVAIDEVKGDNTEIIQYLIKKGANVNAKDILKCTPLYHAIRNNNEKKVQCLIDHGAKITAENEYDLLREAVWINSTEIFLYLIDKGADVREYVDRLLWVAIGEVKGDNTEIIQYLIKKGANVNAKGNEGKTLLMYAINRGDIKIVKCLVENGANVNAKDNEGKTSLMCAVEEGKKVDASKKDEAVKIIEYLFGKNADINAKNNKGNTALDYITGGNLKIIQCLLKHDAKESIPSTEEPKSERGSQK